MEFNNRLFVVVMIVAYLFVIISVCMYVDEEWYFGTTLFFFRKVRVKAGTLCLGLIAFCVVILNFGTLWVSSLVDDEVSVSLPRSTDEYVLQRITNIEPGVSQERLIGQLVNGSIVEATVLGLRTSVTVKSNLSLLVDVKVGEQDHKLLTVPAGRVRFRTTGEKGTFGTIFVYKSVDDAPPIAFVAQQDVRTNECRKAFVNLAWAYHCEPRQVRSEEVFDTEEAIDDLQAVLDVTVERVIVVLSPEDYARLMGARTG